MYLNSFNNRQNPTIISITIETLYCHHLPFAGKIGNLNKDIKLRIAEVGTDHHSGGSPTAEYHVMLSTQQGHFCIARDEYYQILNFLADPMSYLPAPPEPPPIARVISNPIMELGIEEGD